MTKRDPHTVPGSLPDLDALERTRRNMLVAVAATVTLWLAPQIVRAGTQGRLPHALDTVLLLGGMVGALAYVVFMLRFHRFQKRILSEPRLREMMNDERIGALRREAVYRGWIVLVVAVALGVAVAPFVELPVRAVLLTLLLVAVDAPILFYLALDRD